MQVTLPWPPRELSPNARVHWAKLAKAKKAYRELCAWNAASQGLYPVKADRLHVTLEFFPPNRRKHDLDNLLASSKALIDGLADVLRVDDSLWSYTISKSDQVGGYIKVTIEIPS